MTHEQLGREIARLIAETGAPVYVMPGATRTLAIAVTNEQLDDNDITLLVEVHLETVKDSTVHKKTRAGKRIRTADMLLGKQANSDQNGGS